MQIDGISKAPVTSNLPQGDVYLGKLELGPPTEEKELWWSFVQSPRFWVMLIGTVSVYLEAKGWLGVEERNLLASIAALFITVKTIDKLGKNMGA